MNLFNDNSLSDISFEIRFNKNDMKNKRNVVLRFLFGDFKRQLKREIKRELKGELNREPKYEFKRELKREFKQKL